MTSFLLLLFFFSPSLSVPSSTVFSPKVAHTIILFNQPLDPDSSVELVGADGNVIATLSSVPGAFGINFGANLSFCLRFQRPISYQIFEPKLAHSSYILSTLLYDDFVVATAGICLRNDFHGVEGNYGFIYLQDGSYDVKLFQVGLSHGGTLEYATSTERNLPVRSPNIPQSLQLAKFSEWNIEVPSTEASRVLSLSFDTTREGPPRFPPFRQKFEKGSGYVILTKSHNFQLPIDPECSENPTARPPIRDKPLWRNWRDDWTQPQQEQVANPPADSRPNADAQPPARHRDEHEPAALRRDDEEPPARRRDEQEPAGRRRDADDQPPAGHREVEEQPPARRRDEQEPVARRREVEEERVGGRKEADGERVVPPKRAEAQAVVQQPIHSPKRAGFSWWTLLAGLGVVAVIALLVGMVIGNWLFPAPPAVDEGSLVAGAVRRGVVQPGTRPGRGAADGYGIPLVVPRQSQFLQV